MSLSDIALASIGVGVMPYPMLLFPMSVKGFNDWPSTSAVVASEKFVAIATQW